MNKRFYRTLTQTLLVLSDILSIIISFILAYWIRFHWQIIPVTKGIPPINVYLHALLITIFIWLFIFAHKGLYQVNKPLVSLTSFYSISKAVFLGTFALMALTFLIRYLNLSRVVVFLGLLINPPVITGIRKLVIKSILYIRKKRNDLINILIIGNGNLASSLGNKIKSQPQLEYRLVGFVEYKPDLKSPMLTETIVKVNSINDNENIIASISQDSNFNNNSSINSSLLAVVKNTKQLEEIIEKYQIDEIIIATNNISQEEIIDLMLSCEKQLVRLSIAPDLFQIMADSVAVDELAGYPLLHLKESPLLSGWNIVIKRTMDIIISLIGLILASPLMAIIAILIKRDSPGPIIYRQERIGIDGKKFIMYKFRSMIDNAEKDTGPVWATENDPRCTKIGRVLRRYSLDELPQLFNVLKGDMSLVGPRPERPYFVDLFKERIPRYMARHRVKSGITGWAQVNGLRGNTSIEERTKYDLYYIENWSILFDIKILLKTFFG